MWGAITVAVVRSLTLICLLLVTAPVATWAQSAQQTGQAQTTVSTDETKVTQLSAQRTKTAQRSQDQLAAVDRLKKQKASWRRDRELRESLADSADTANQLATLNTQLATALRTLAQARNAYDDGLVRYRLAIVNLQTLTGTL